jgi:hypothetical protein
MQWDELGVVLVLMVFVFEGISKEGDGCVRPWYV